MATEVLKPTIIGSLACQKNSFVKNDFQTVVLRCEPTQKTTLYEVELQDTILFPEGGGQPGDTGFILPAGSVEEIIVSQVARKGLHAVHYVNKFIEPGSKVELQVNWTQRLDYMQQHTGQHLLSAILENEWQLDTLSWSMGGTPSDKKPNVEPSDLFNYVEIGRNLSDEEIIELSDLCNEYITTKAQAIEVDQQGSEDCDSEKGVMRTVRIGELDANPCCGTHLQSTSQIGSILISPFQNKVRGKNSKLYFMCGSRVLKYARFSHSITSRAKTLLSCTEAEVPQKIEFQRIASQKISKREQYWVKEFASSNLVSIIQAVELRKKGHLAVDEFGTLDVLAHIQKGLNLEIEKRQIQDYNIVLCGREKATNSGAILILSNSGTEIVSTASEISGLVQKLKGGGGKNGGKWQGKVIEYGELEWDLMVQFLSESF
ncbi:LANO_0G12552g1_1 [Lachancea nothofagi CBS 11611]|uniref:LANO_0G12552g1_1 n=1 Tax=Lachancea nothofagi CBS 11611 TaxID=1266666 RepID=A0A1G4KJS1_9SACH|nr:LANO_0G12552g1_1 [Lachancea nothofagi CBS 11611]